MHEEQAALGKNVIASLEDALAHKRGTLKLSRAA
jgi:hypothetical protein